jgi:hypothetical protein
MKWMSVGILAMALWACGPELPGEDVVPVAAPVLSTSASGLGAAPITPGAPGAIPPGSVGNVPVTATSTVQPLTGAVDPLAVPQDPIPCLNTHPDGNPGTGIVRPKP